MDEPIFTEKQVFYQNPVVRVAGPAVVIGGGGAMAVAISSGPPLLVAILALVILLPMLLAFMALRTEVTPTELRFAMRPLVRRRLPIESIDEVEAVQYNPIGDAGGWGVRLSPRFGLVVNVTGNRGVRVVAGRKRYLLGSLRADELAAAIEVAREAAMELPQPEHGETPTKLMEA